MPDHSAHPVARVSASGVAEILGGVGLLVPRTRRFSAAGIVLMLIVFLEVYQFVLIAWGATYSRRSRRLKATG
jgi:uncharacterized membrane protein YphA (DoxX/SURF4 family)